jgi:hypothetical protein
MKQLLTLLAALALLRYSTQAAPPVVIGWPDPITTIAAEPSQSQTIDFEWLVQSDKPISKAAAFVNQYWPPPNGVRTPAGPFLPITIEDRGSNLYALRIPVWIHPYFRWPGMWFPPLAMKSTQSWSLNVTTEDGTVATQETFLLVLPLESGTQFRLAPTQFSIAP